MRSAEEGEDKATKGSFTFQNVVEANFPDVTNDRHVEGEESPTLAVSVQSVPWTINCAPVSSRDIDGGGEAAAKKRITRQGGQTGKIPICMHLPIRSIYVRVVRASIYKVTISGIICANSKRSADVSNARVLLQYVCTLPWVFV